MVRFQYRLRSLLVLVTIMAIPLGWIPWKRREIESRQKEIEIADRNLRCNVDYDYEIGRFLTAWAWLAEGSSGRPCVCRAAS